MIQQLSCGDTIAGRVHATPECFQVGKLQTWHTKKGCVQMQYGQNQKSYAVSQNYTFYLHGHVNYTNFNEDYQYHGERKMPPAEPAHYQLTLYRQAAIRGADVLQRGDVVLNEQRLCEVVQSVKSLHIDDMVSTDALRTGDVYGQWHNWLLTHVVNVNVSDVNYDVAIGN